MAQIRTKTRDTVLVDELRESPVDRDLARTTRIVLLIVAVIVAALLIVPRLRAAPAAEAAAELGPAFLAAESCG